jgi:hypothetical protein
MMRTKSIVLGALFLVVACGGKDGPSGDGTDSDSGIPTSGSPTSASSDPSATSVMMTDSGSATTDDTSATATASSSPTDTDSTGDSSGSLENDGTANDPDNPLDCGGTIYECGDGEDNDGDGHTDLFDPECTGPCDDDEGSFQTGIPGDNMDCKQDCFFDGNSGQGDDGCIWDLRCDPENPGANIGCEYTGGNNCNNQPPNQDADCVEFCLQFVPPGCDCFGCCTVQTDEGEVDIFLNSHPDCSLENLAACEPCTQDDSCINDCTPAECEVCFGETEPPKGCDEGMCDQGDPCMSNADCPTDYACYLGCCYPPPPG